METFVPYHHIDGRAKALKLLEAHPLPEGTEWYAYRKIDGSNFSVWVERTRHGRSVRFARRNGWLEFCERFQNSHVVQEDLTKSAYKLADILTAISSSWIHFEVFGELYGTVDRSLRTTPGLSRIQGRIFYGPDVYFTVYDIRVDGTYMAKNWTEQIGSAAGFDVLTPMARGPLHKLLQNVGTAEAPGPWYPGKLASTICERHGHEMLEGNMEEGVVLVTRDVFLLGPNRERAIMKITPESEHIGRVAPQRQPKQKKSTDADVSALPANIQPWFSFLEDLIDEDRYASATSKLGACKLERIAGEMTADILSMAYERGELELFMEVQIEPLPREEYAKAAKQIKPLLYKRCLDFAKAVPLVEASQ